MANPQEGKGRNDTVSELRALEVTSPVAIVDGDAIMKAAMAPVIQEIRIETPGAAHDNAAVDSPKDMNVFRLNGAIPQGLTNSRSKERWGRWSSLSEWRHPMKVLWFRWLSRRRRNLQDLGRIRTQWQV